MPKLKTAYKVKMVPIDDVHPYPNNPRKISDAAIDAVAASLRDVGWQQELVVWPNAEGKLEIVVGHCRLLAAQKLGMTEVPCAIAADLTEDQVRRYRIIDNKSGEKAVWDFELLQLEFSKIDLSHETIDTSFSPVEIATILNADWVPPVTSGEGPEDQAAGVDTPTDEKHQYSITLKPSQYDKFLEAASILRATDTAIKDGEAVRQISEDWYRSRLSKGDA